MEVGEIEVQAGRVLLIPKKDKGFYHVITTKKEIKGLEIGDTIEYEPYGGNFGLFVAKK